MTEGAVPAEQLDNADVSTEDSQLTVNRREFLNLAWLASLGFLTLSLGGMTILFSYPRFKEGEFGGIFTFGTIADLPELGILVAWKGPDAKTITFPGPRGLVCFVTRN